ncbi:MAG TPA: helix-turn-helix domain-containing protein [Pirellulales bacterium]|nr:helix-turn-helix domain-containing protein [Pirellulales bacterium]
MPSRRGSAAQLARLLDAVNEPIYAVDADRKVVFCNEACLTWIGCAAEELIGQECRYHAGEELSGGAALAAALCPPPAALSGRGLAAEVVLPSADAVKRIAHFIPLGSVDSSSQGVLAIVRAMAATEENEPASGELAGAKLHARLQHCRRQLALRGHVDRLWGDSPAMKRVRGQVLVAAESMASVLVLGPPGSGREHVARAIHYGDGAAQAGPLVPLASELLDAELLSATLHTLMKPAPDLRRPATLMLGNVDAMPAAAQLELARFLVGGRFAARVVSTAREPLAGLASRGAFRPDLACLLNTLTIELPALAKRPEDLPLAAQWFLEQANARSPKQIGGFSAEALDQLSGYAWPGDLGELESIVNESHARAETHEITPRDLPPRLVLAAEAAARPRKPDESVVLEEFLGQIERELIERAMKRAKGNKTKAARLLGLTRPRLYRRLVQLGLEQAEDHTE